MVNFDETYDRCGVEYRRMEELYDIYEPKGCEKCNGTGYKGRLAIHEALYFTKEIRQLIVSSGVEVDEETDQRSSKERWNLKSKRFRIGKS